MLVLEPPDGDRTPDGLADEFEVAARLPLTPRMEQLDEALRHWRPRLLLCKLRLDQLDERLVAVCLARNVDILVLAHPVYGLLQPARLRRFGGLPWLRLRPARSGEQRIKRTLDLTVTLLGMPLLIPLLLLITVAAGLGGPPLYVQERVGAGGRRFRMVKFRTMHPDAERDTGPALAGVDDDRVTRVGRLLRRFRLDELPQLWNVLRGDMSLVGPRPERPEFVASFRDLPHYELRHSIRPGLTGIAQLTGGYAATVEDKLRCDLLYLHCRSLRLDLLLVLLTIAELFRGFPRG
ncbi:sugar transferase [Micromonospora sp. WMMD1102]|uniref:sugar transferase n=1 Tax=Micromonospora sp. WMMD1102 TaxID=3016105 RepID=UPI00241576A7|nr:sugar transferase [Micromonospora sp. WMMD1102]MDG4786349.1 sugar transferase [Micromonospora sp. WMMD1102]